MTPDQFKAWFEGFCEGITEAPTPEQWVKIKAKVGELKSFAAAPTQPPNWNRQWVQNGNPIEPNRLTDYAVGRNPSPIPAPIPFPVSHETRLVDPVSGRDLGCSD